MPDGDLLVIANAFDDQDQLIAVKSARVTKQSGASVGTISVNMPGLVSVYNLQGMLLRENVPSVDWHTGLPSGLYIVNGRKLIVR